MFFSIDFTLILLLVSAQQNYATAIKFVFEFIDNDTRDFANRNWLARDSLFVQNVEAAANLWGDYIDSEQELEVWVYADNMVARSAASFTNGRNLGFDGNGNPILEPSSLSKILTGDNPNARFQPDITIRLNPAFVDAEYWFDSTPHDRRDSKPPVGRTDFVSIILHEFGHGFGFAGNRKTSPGPHYGTVSGFGNLFDALSFFTGSDSNKALNDNGHPNAFFFNGTRASSLYGGPVPLTNDGPYGILSSQNFYHLGNCESPIILRRSLMNGCSVPDDGSILQITPLDLAMLEDLGYPLTRPPEQAPEMIPPTDINVDPIRPWWDRVKANYDSHADAGSHLKMCAKRGTTPPTDGTQCSVRPKTCFFGTQDCGPIATLYPIAKCVCMNSAWNCTAAPLECPLTANDPI